METDKKDLSNLVDQTFGITADQVREFAFDHFGDMQCSCKNGFFTLAEDQGGKPSLLAIQDPRDRDSEHWFFWVICNHCAQTRMISASSVWAKLHTRVSSDDK